jgi:hypothetical protein
MALNARQERFAELIAVGLVSQAEAAREVGYSPKVADRQASYLVRKPEIASRIDQLRAKRSALASVRHDVSRDKLIKELSKIAFADIQDPPRQGDKLKAAEMLAKLLGYNEPEAVTHNHQHVHVDAGLIAELRSGYVRLQGAHTHKSLEASVVGGGAPQAEATLANIKPPPPSPLSGGTPNTEATPLQENILEQRAKVK